MNNEESEKKLARSTTPKSKSDILSHTTTMRSCAPEEILSAFPDAQSFSVPNEFFNSLPRNIDVFSSLYQWMIDTRRVASDKVRHLLDRTFIGDKVARRLLAAEKRRIARYAHVHGKELERAVAWSDLDTGPRTEFAHRRIRGDLVIVLPDDTDAINAVRSEWRWEAYNRQLATVKKRASGSSFYEWLASSCDRDDCVGDLARDALDDPEFPRDAQTYLDLQSYFEDQTAADAWLEYAEKYPERMKKRVLCDECAGEICDLNSGLVACTAWGDCFEIVHMNCRDENTRWQIQLSAANLAEALRDCVQQNAIPPQLVDAIEEQLKLSGFVLSFKARSLVYFMEANPSGAIKIGYSGSLRQAENRRNALQSGRHPETLRIKAVMEGDLRLEKELHRQFAVYSLGGEWFSPHRDLLDFIAANARDPYSESRQVIKQT